MERELNLLMEDPSTERSFHRVNLINLDPDESYIYHVGSQYGWSALYYFTTFKDGSNWSPRFAVYGDMGNKNAQSLGRLQQATQKGEFDMILHVGDMAYNMADNNGIVGDQFMRQIEPIAAYIPYMTVPGNHENAYNFSHYVNRFTMPGNNANLFYSFDLGPAHFIGISNEFYFFTEFGWEQIPNQFAWLEKDLKKANANRKKVPWIITMGHRPMYCVSADSDDCTKYESIIRSGLPYVHSYGLEDLFYKYRVDLEIWAHEHNYQRMWPLYNRTVYNGTENPYRNPVAPVHIVTGSAGCQEHTDKIMRHTPPWSAFNAQEYGFSRMQIFNSTHLYLDFLQDDTGEVIDTIWLIKDKHGPYKDEIRKRAKGQYVSKDWRHPLDTSKCEECSRN